jgi:hypothetical protein
MTKLVYIQLQIWISFAWSPLFINLGVQCTRQLQQYRVVLANTGCLIVMDFKTLNK